MSKTNELASRVQHLARVTYKPEIGHQRDSGLTNSHTHGMPLVLSNEEHPVCGSCNSNLANLIHLNLEELPVIPHGFPKKGAIQILTCANRHTTKDKRCKGQDWKAFSNTKLCRLLSPEQVETSSTSLQTVSFYQAYFIESWSQSSVLPNPEESCVKDLQLSDDDLKTYMRLYKKGDIHSESKYLGWPHFFNDVQYDPCPQCGEKMSFLFQYPTELRQLGKTGAIVQYCPRHPEILTYVWADKNTSKSQTKAAILNKSSSLYRYRSLARPAYFPVFDRGSSYSLDESRIGGVSLLLPNEETPRCGSCSANMSIILQLNLAKLPERPKYLPEFGLLQIFKCTNEETAQTKSCKSENWRGFSDSKLCRIISTEEIPLLRVGSSDEDMVARWIKSWNKSDYDFPHNEEAVLNLRDDDFDDYVDALLELPQGAKYLGWPQFCQGLEYETCPKCSTEMKFVFQLESDDHESLINFGEDGVCTIQICPNHPEVITYNWACS